MIMRTDSPVRAKKALLHINDSHQQRDTARKTTKRTDKRVPPPNRATQHKRTTNTRTGKSVKYDRPSVQKVGGGEGSHIVTI